jgi:serine/threonine-protein kinase
VLHQIGAGTLGPVFRAHDPTSGRLVALKVFEIDLVPERAASLALELSHLVDRGLTHSAVTAPVGAGVRGSLPYLASEYVASETLDIVARRSRPAVSGDVPWIIRRVAEAIDFGASQGAEHGLLHPRDVLVTDSDARVTGLGVGRALERVGVPLPVRRPYSAPERVDGAPWTPAADIYSLAVLAYELLLNKRFAGDGGQLTIRPDELPGADIDGVCDVLSRSLATQPDKRHRTAKAFVRDLDAALSGTTTKSTSLPLLDSTESTTSESSPRTGIASLPSESPETPSAGSVPLEGIEPNQDARPREAALKDQAVVSMSGDGIFGAGAAFDRPAKRRGRGIVIGAVLVAAAAVAGYLAVARWWGEDQLAGGKSETEAIVTPPEAAPAAAPTSPGLTETASPTPPAASSEPPAAPVTSPAGRQDDLAEAKPSAPPVSKTAPVAASGRMLIRSTPTGAQVFVNGVVRGMTPLVLRNLPFGSYAIRIALPGFAPSDHRVVLDRNREAQSLEAILQEGEVLPAQVDSPSQAKLGSILVVSRPAGATVYFDNQPMGQTPLTVSDLPIGPRTVRLELDGYRSWSSTVQVVAGARERVAASLERTTTR